MGCKKLSYYEREGLRSNSLFLIKGGLEKVDRFEKKRLNYYPFGSPLPGRNQISSPQYEHGYQGQFTERDEETGLDAFELRMWDSRLARWTSTDPYGQFHSPYLGMGNNPVSSVDPDGGFSWVNAAIGAGIGAGLGYGGAALAGVPKEDRWKYAVGGAVAGGAVGGIWGQNIGNLFRKDTPWNAEYSKLNKAKPTNWQFDGTKTIRETFTLQLTDMARNSRSIGFPTVFRSITSATAALTSTYDNSRILKDVLDVSSQVEYKLSFSAPQASHGVASTYNFNVDGGGSATLNGGDGTVSPASRFTLMGRNFKRGSSSVRYNIPKNPSCDCYDGQIRVRVRFRVPVNYRR